MSIRARAARRRTIVRPQALDAKLSSAEIDDEIIAPALWLIGELWQRQEIRVLALQREAQRLKRARWEHQLAPPPSG
jgi:hypothetical protein